MDQCEQESKAALLFRVCLDALPRPDRVRPAGGWPHRDGRPAPWA